MSHLSPHTVHIKAWRSLPIASQLKHLLIFCRRKRLNGTTTRVVWRKWCRETEKKKLKTVDAVKKVREISFSLHPCFYPLYSYLLLFLTTTVLDKSSLTKWYPGSYFSMENWDYLLEVCKSLWLDSHTNPFLTQKSLVFRLTLYPSYLS